MNTRLAAMGTRYAKSHFVLLLYILQSLLCKKYSNIIYSLDTLRVELVLKTSDCFRILRTVYLLFVYPFS